MTPRNAAQQAAMRGFALPDREARRALDAGERDEAHEGRIIDGLMMSAIGWMGAIMSNVYLVALLISNASGNVESIEAVDAVTQGGCTNMARQMHALHEPTPQGYELKFTCGTREALETALVEHQCRVVDQRDSKGIVTTSYACDPTGKNKFVGWIKSVF